MAMFTAEFFKLTGPRWRLAMALAAVEQGAHATLTNTVYGNEYAVGDSGDARGLWQIHRLFAATYDPESDVPVALTWQLRGDPWIQNLTMNVFLVKHAARNDRDTAIIFHYGHETAEDPHGYWTKVQTALARINAALPETA